MGQLVFQATLGGQVNLVGPNTASTFNINVPAIAGTMVTTGDTGTVTNTMLAGSIANAKLTNSSVTIGSTSVALGATAATVAGLTLTNPVINGFTGDTSVINVGSGQFYKDTSGNVGIGTSSPSRKLDVQSAIAATYTTANDIQLLLNASASTVNISATYNTTGSYVPLAFYTGGSERARIDTSGNLLVGQSIQSTTERLGVNFTGNNDGQYTLNSSANPTGSAYVANYTSGTGVNTTNCIFYKGRSASTDRFYVYGNGNVVNLNNSYGTLSDIKLKENIIDATPKLGDVMKLQVRNFNLKIDPDHKQIGFIAQELEQIFPALIDETPEMDAKGNATSGLIKSIKISVLVPILVKAIQELKAELDAAIQELATASQEQQALISSQAAAITALTERIAALESQ